MGEDDWGAEGEVEWLVGRWHTKGGIGHGSRKPIDPTRGRGSRHSRRWWSWWDRHTCWRRNTAGWHLGCFFVVFFGVVIVFLVVSFFLVRSFLVSKTTSNRIN